MSVYAATGHSAHRLLSIKAAERFILAEFAEMIAWTEFLTLIYRWWDSILEGHGRDHQL